MFVKSSYCCSHSCVEVDVDFKKSTFSALTSCVQVKRGDQVAVRDSKDEGGPSLVFTHDEWQAFLDGAKAGEFDV